MPRLVLAGTSRHLDKFLDRCQAACLQQYGPEEGPRRFQTLTVLDAITLLSR